MQPEVSNTAPVKSRAKPVPIPYAKGTEEHKEELRKRARERYQARAKGATEKDKKVSYFVSKPANALPLLNKPALTVKVPTALVPVFGETFMLNNDISTWYFMHVKPLAELSEVTQKQYKQTQNRLQKHSPDMWERIRHVIAQPLAIKAQFIKAWLSRLSEILREIYTSALPAPKRSYYESIVREMFLYAHLSKGTRKEVKSAQFSQVASPERIDNTVPWSEWVNKAKSYVKALATKKDASFEDYLTMALIALYSYLPPIRLDYDNVIVVKSVPDKITENTLVLAPANKRSSFYWVKFKNSAAFEREGTLPVVINLDKDLVKIIKLYWAAKKKLIPRNDRLFIVPHFSEKLTEVAELVTNKHFTNRLMRSSFIQDFYNKVQEGKLSLGAIHAMMRSVHQTDISTNISYIKRLAEEGLD